MLWNTGSPAFAGDDDNLCGSALLAVPPGFHGILTVNLHPRIPEQHARGFFRGARHRRIVAHQVLRDRAVDEQRELRGKAFRIGDAELQQKIAEPETAAFLESDRDLL